ncbi:MAG: 4Fe-4S binding protein [Coprococcus sp.]
MEKNIKGFLYPNLDETKCVACGLCMKACPLSEK